jgi:nucleotide-binding universal stress UspA family protein
VFNKLLVIPSETISSENILLSILPDSLEIRGEQKLAGPRESSVSFWNSNKLIGNSAKAIVSYVEEKAIELLVMGDGYWGTKNMASIGWKVIQRTNTALLLVKAKCTNSIGVRSPRKILVPLDGSEFGETAIPYAELVAQRSDSQLILMHALLPVYNWGLGNPNSYYVPCGNLAKQKIFARFYLDSLAKDIRRKDLAVSSEVVSGRPGRHIIDFANDDSINMIVMATHGRSGIGRWIFECTAESVMKFGNKTVLIIKPDLSNRR